MLVFSYNVFFVHITLVDTSGKLDKYKDLLNLSVKPKLETDSLKRGTLLKIWTHADTCLIIVLKSKVKTDSLKD